MKTQFQFLIFNYIPEKLLSSDYILLFRKIWWIKKVGEYAIMITMAPL